MAQPQQQSYKDWPNYQGFNSDYKERDPVELQVTGEIPPWAAGVLFRTGIGPREIESDKKTTFRVNHWFDGLAVVHRFQILPPDAGHSSVRVLYNSRSTCDKVIEDIKKTGARNTITFAAKYEPCLSFFQKVMSIFRPAPPPQGPDSTSMSITLSVNFPGLDAKGQKLKAGHASGIQTLCNKTDAGRLQMLDPETLEPVGLAAQSVLHPELKGPLSAAHARSDPKTGDMYNYNLDLGRKGLYRVFHVSAATGETSILATFPADAAYIHSFFITENYIVLCVWNSFFAAGGIKILWNRNLVDAMSDYDGSRPARWYVIDRRTPANGGKGVVATYESDDFFCFHTVNAHEVPSESGTGKDIVADLIAYDNLDCIKRFYISNLISTSESAAKYAEKPNYCTVYKRFRLPGIPDADSTKTAPTLKAKLDFQAEAAQTPELPTLNPHYLTRPHRYVYGANFTGKSTFMDTLIKYDVEAREAKQWYSHGQNPGEPIFVPRPGGSDEDDGVLLSVVLDGLAGKSYLLVLDAKSLQEVARAHVNGAIGFGFHGTHVSAAKDAVPLSL